MTLLIGTMGAVWLIEWFVGVFVSRWAYCNRLGSLFWVFLIRLLLGAGLVGSLGLAGAVDLSLLGAAHWDSPIRSMEWLGAEPRERWADAFLGFLFVISCVTALAIFLPNRKQIDRNRFSLVSLVSVVIFAAINALIEELTFRLLPLGFSGVSVEVAVWISAISFGIPHYFGFPSRIIGVVLATFLGWFLAEMTVQTGSLAGAFLIHWAQDIVILGLLSGARGPSPFRIISDEPIPSLARAFALGLFAVAIFQLALALGAPWGAAAWGGQFVGVLPAKVRIASAAVIGIYLLFGAIFLARCRLLSLPISQAALGRWTTGIAVFLCFGVILNFISPSQPERVLMGPTALLLTSAAVLIVRKAKITIPNG